MRKPICSPGDPCGTTKTRGEFESPAEEGRLRSQGRRISGCRHNESKRVSRHGLVEREDVLFRERSLTVFPGTVEGRHKGLRHNGNIFAVVTTFANKGVSPREVL